MKLELSRIDEIKRELEELEIEDDRKVEEAKQKAMQVLDIKEEYVDFNDWYKYFDKEWSNYYHSKKQELEEEEIVVKATNVEIGDGISLSPYSDWKSYTVIDRKETPKGFTLTVQEDKAIRTDEGGMSDCQDYRFERNSEGCIRTVKWNSKKNWFTADGYRVKLGRYAYYDYSF